MGDWFGKYVVESDQVAEAVPTGNWFDTYEEHPAAPLSFARETPAEAGKRGVEALDLAIKEGMPLTLARQVATERKQYDEKVKFEKELEAEWAKPAVPMSPEEQLQIQREVYSEVFPGETGDAPATVAGMRQYQLGLARRGIPPAFAPVGPRTEPFGQAIEMQAKDDGNFYKSASAAFRNPKFTPGALEVVRQDVRRRQAKLDEEWAAEREKDQRETDQEDKEPEPFRELILAPAARLVKEATQYAIRGHPKLPPIEFMQRQAQLDAIRMYDQQRTQAAVDAWLPEVRTGLAARFGKGVWNAGVVSILKSTEAAWGFPITGELAAQWKVDFPGLKPPDFEVLDEAEREQLAAEADARIVRNAARKELTGEPMSEREWRIWERTHGAATPWNWAKRIVGIQVGPKKYDLSDQELPWAEVTPATTVAEKSMDALAGLTAYMAVMAVTRKILPPGTSEYIIFEASNQAMGGKPGRGLMYRAALSGMGKFVPGPGYGPLVVRTGAASVLLGGGTYLGGGDTKDILISAGIPFIFAARGVGKKQWLAHKNKKAYIANLKVQIPALAKRSNAEIEKVLGEIIAVEKMVLTDRQMELNRMPYRELQAAAKGLGIKGNQKADALRVAIATAEGATLEGRVAAAAGPPTAADEAVGVTTKLTGEIAKSLKAQKKLSGQVQASYTKERGQRVTAYKDTFNRLLKQGLTVAEATAKAKAQHKGALEKEPVPTELLPKLTPAEWDVLHRAALEMFSTRETSFTQMRATDAINKLQAGDVLQENEIALMAEIFGPKLGRAIRAGQGGWGWKAYQGFLEVSGAMKTVAGGDVSYSARQLWPVFMRDVGRTLTGKPTGTWFVSVGKQLRAYFSQEQFDEYQRQVRASPHYGEAVKHGLPLTDVGEFVARHLREEHFPSRVMAKVPLIKQGERAAVVAGNVSKMLIYEQLRADAVRAGRPITPEFLTKISKHAGNLTGRAVLPGMKHAAVRELATIANAAMFSPRFKLSRINNLRTLFGTLSTDPTIRADGIRTLAAGIASVTATAAVANAFGGDVETDPRSADFLKAKFGDTRVDLTGGHGVVMRFMARMALAESKTQAGQISDIDRDEVIWQFAKSSRAPLMGLMAEIYTGEDFVGRPIEGVEGYTDAVLNRITFLWLKEGIDTTRLYLEEHGLLEALGAGVAATAAEFVGLSAQTYAPTARTEEATLRDRLAQEAYGKDWEDLGPRELQRLARTHREELGAAREAKDIEGATREDFDYIGRIVAEGKAAGREVVEMLQPEAQEAIAKRGITLSLERKITKGGVAWIMKDEVFARYKELTVLHLDKRLTEKVKQPEWAELHPLKKKARIRQMVDKAKERARMEVQREADRK